MKGKIKSMEAYLVNSPLNVSRFQKKYNLITPPNQIIVTHVIDDFKCMKSYIFIFINERLMMFHMACAFLN
jgi:hypothetical protein